MRALVCVCVNAPARARPQSKAETQKVSENPDLSADPGPDSTGILVFPSVEAGAASADELLSCSSSDYFPAIRGINKRLR